MRQMAKKASNDNILDKNKNAPKKKKEADIIMNILEKNMPHSRTKSPTKPEKSPKVTIIKKTADNPKSFI